MYAKLQHFFQHATENRFIAAFGWQQCNWVDTAGQASKFPHESALQLADELAKNEPGYRYVVERDDNGTANLPPYGLDNFVVRRA